jgi:hypothetical protein
MRFDFLYNLSLKYFSLCEELSEIWSKPYIGTRVKCSLFLADLNETNIFRKIFDRFSNIKFYEKTSSGSRIVPCGRTDGQADRQIDIRKLTVSFRNFTNAPKNENNWKHIYDKVINSRE